jgi:hypothetical protein
MSGRYSRVDQRSEVERSIAVGVFKGAKRDKTDLGYLAFAEAAFSRRCSGNLLAVQRISPERPLRGSKLGIPKPPFRRALFQQSGCGRSEHLITSGGGEKAVIRCR